MAIPKQSVFVRKRVPPSASIVVKLHPGRSLDRSQVEAVVHLVASSVPELEADNVTVVDQKGKLLNGERRDSELKLTATQFEYTRQLEDHYRQRVESLLEPIVGGGAVRAQVSADVDFTQTEQTEERFNPERPVLRSEQLSEDQNRLAVQQGVPGALSNQPPANATGAPEGDRARCDGRRGVGAGEPEPAVDPQLRDRQDHQPHAAGTREAAAAVSCSGGGQRLQPATEDAEPALAPAGRSRSPTRSVSRWRRVSPSALSTVFSASIQTRSPTFCPAMPTCCRRGS